MAFLDELRRRVDGPSKNGIDPKLLAFANEYYNKQVKCKVNEIKNSLRKVVEYHYKNNPNSKERTFSHSDLFMYSMSDGSHIIDNMGFDFDLSNENDLFHTYMKDNSQFLKLKRLYNVKITEREEKLFIIPTVYQYVRVELTELGKRYFADIKNSCEKEGIVITRLYAKKTGSHPEEEFPLDQDYKIGGHSYYFKVWLDYKIDL